jgi:hypothetical protein
MESKSVTVFSGSMFEPFWAAANSPKSFEFAAARATGLVYVRRVVEVPQKMAQAAAWGHS